MAQNSQETKSKSKGRRTEVKDLPKQEKELSKEEQKKVKGGVGTPHLLRIIE